MKRWAAMTAGLLIWAAHFLGLYLLASAADVWASTETLAGRAIGLAFSLFCLALIGLATIRLHQRRPAGEAEQWERRVALTGALIAALGVVWQTAPLAF